MVAVPNKLKRRAARNPGSRPTCLARQTSAPPSCITSDSDFVRSSGLRVSWNLGPHASLHKTVTKQQGMKAEAERRRSKSESCVPTTAEEVQEERAAAVSSVQVPAYGR